MLFITLRITYSLNYTGLCLTMLQLKIQKPLELNHANKSASNGK